MNIVNEDVIAYITGLYRPLNEQMGSIRKQAEENHIPIILPDTETLLLNLIRLKKPAAVLEVGAAVGYSSCCFALAEEHCSITTIEADKRTYDKALETIASLCLKHRINVLLGEGQEVIPRLNDPYDFVFIDAAKSHYRTFWDDAIKLCNPGALIVCDNVLMKGMTVSDVYDPRKKYKTSIRKMRSFLNYICHLPQVDTSVLPVGDGVSISILKG